MKRTLILLSTTVVIGCWCSSPLAADEEANKILEQYKPVIDKGLDWLAKQQFRDGHWEANGGNYPIAMTGLAGLALLAEGSTPHQGKYAKNLEKAVDYLLARAQKKTGLIGRPDDQREQQRYMYAHGYATLFLAQVFGEETDESRRRELEQVLTKAVDFIGKAQTNLGGWGYVSAADSRSLGAPDFDEGSVTITQLQALRGARNAGIPVSKDVIDKAKEYLKKSTQVVLRDQSNPMREEAGIIYSLRQGGGNVRPTLTAAGIACMFSAGEYKNDLAIKWLNYCQRHIAIDKSGRDNFHWEYTHLYYAQVMYILGEDRHAQVRPDLAEQEKKENKPALLKWSRYRETVFDYIRSRQNSDGSWNQVNQGGFDVGPIYATALQLIVLQLDKGNLPIYQR
jgi:hypothetical protein